MKTLDTHLPPFSVPRFLGSTARGASIMLTLLLASCTECGKSCQTDTTQGVSSRVPPETSVSAPVDTIWGFVGDGTSMHVIELVCADVADTLRLVLEDEADHRANLTVGNKIGVAVQRLPDGQLTVLATFDADTPQH